ncbi:unnamed protein product [Haemonchus placei]|uniref:DDE Tnp4 domain-containing protein n=1 Tax=Haemonchus placei TaxID=6290 RepID=A0A0N4VXT4_HAEPC|nr:unnamed protein product [Haemonchus placei]
MFDALAQDLMPVCDFSKWSCYFSDSGFAGGSFMVGPLPVPSMNFKVQRSNSAEHLEGGSSDLNLIEKEEDIGMWPQIWSLIARNVMPRMREISKKDQQTFKKLYFMDVIRHIPSIIHHIPNLCQTMKRDVVKKQRI